MADYVHPYISLTFRLSSLGVWLPPPPPVESRSCSHSTHSPRTCVASWWCGGWSDGRATIEVHHTIACSPQLAPQHCICPSENSTTVPPSRASIGSAPSFGSVFASPAKCSHSATVTPQRDTPTTNSSSYACPTPPPTNYSGWPTLCLRSLSPICPRKAPIDRCFILCGRNSCPLAIFYEICASFCRRRSWYITVYFTFRRRLTQYCCAPSTWSGSSSGWA